MALTWLTQLWTARRRPRPRVRPTVEPLETRALPTAVGGPVAAEVVTGLYIDLLHRAPLAPEIAAWTSPTDGTVDPQQVVAGILEGTEFRSALINQDYQALLGRSPELGMVGAWLTRMQQGLTPQQFLLQIVASTEYYQTHGGGTPAGWVTALYVDVIGRQPDSGGLFFWTQRIQGGMSLVSVASGLIYNTEANSRQVAGLYQTLLGRNPDLTGSNTWVAAMNQGLTIEQVAQGLASSPEYLGQQVGINVAATLAVAGGRTNTGAAGSAVALYAPDFTTSTQPVVAVALTNPNFVGRVRIDVDMNHDGVLTDLGDLNQTAGFVTPGSPAVVLNALPAGHYQLRVRARDLAGNEIVSAPVPMVIDPNAGFVGSTTLLRLVNDYTAAAQAGPPSASFYAARQQLLVFDDFGRVEVNVHATLTKYLNGLTANLQSWGMSFVSMAPWQNMITGFLPITRIADLPTLPHFASVTPVYAPVTRAGAVNSQGDSVTGASAFRLANGFTGQGITIGGISNTVNQVDSNNDGIAGIAESQLSGDLPAEGVNVLEDGYKARATDEGRAMLEIAHDVAPSAHLAFHTGTISPQDMADGIRGLAAAGSQVIFDDIGWFDSPFFNDGVIAQAVDQVTAQGVFYASAAGNEGAQGFLSYWKGTTSTVVGLPGTYFDLGGGDVLQDFRLGVGKQFLLSFQWDNAFLEGGSSQPNYQVPTEIDVLITTADGKQILQALNDNTRNTNEAAQIGVFTNDGSYGTNHFAMAFLLRQGPAPRVIRWVAHLDDPHAQGEGAPTIFGQVAAKGAVAVGAAPWFAPAVPETYSSLGGGLPIYFDAQGNRLAVPEIRFKPNIIGPDGVDNTFFGYAPYGTDPDQLPRFFGTSAATPHVAAAAALFLQQFPPADPSLILQHMEVTTRTARNSPGDPVTGAGFLQVFSIISAPPPSGGGGGLSGTDGVHVGDVFEPNDTSDRATDFGLLTGGVQTFLSLQLAPHDNGLPDVDWYRWTAARSGTFTVALQYQSLGDFDVRVFTMGPNNTLMELGAGLSTGTGIQVVSVPVTFGEPLYVWVYGYKHAIGSYNMEVGIA
jgi:hypothetical protein